ncbi:Hypothetical protein KVN_LOCUS288 [uncultured virus]|nr:Hypothetical protein KVN_LOCUS288 [uncultured virus]
MDKFFFSDKNVSRQCGYLEKMLNIKGDSESKKRCKKFLVKQMQEIYKKYGNKRPNNVPVPQFIDLLNRKSIEECIKICENRKKNKKQLDSNQLHQVERARDKEIYGKRDVKIQKRPIVTHTKKNTNGLMPTYSDSGGLSNFATVPKGEGGYIGANGELGDQMFFGNINDYINTKKNDSKDDLEKRILERVTNYSPKTQQPMPGFNMYGNQNFYNNTGKPMELNFALDGTDTRGMDINTKQRPNNNSNNMFDFDSNLTGFDSNNLMNNMFDQNMTGDNQNLMGNLMDQNMMSYIMNQGLLNNNVQNQNMPTGINNVNQNMINSNFQNTYPNLNQYPLDQNINKNSNYQSANILNDTELQKNLNKIMAEREQFDKQSVPPNNDSKQFNPMVSPNLVNNNLVNNILGKNLTQKNNNMDLNQILMIQKMQDMLNANNSNNQNNYLNSKGRANINNNIKRGGSLNNYQNSSLMVNNMTSEELDNYIKNFKETLVENQLNFPNLNLEILQTMDSKELDKVINKVSTNLVNMENLKKKNFQQNDNFLTENNIKKKIDKKDEIITLLKTIKNQESKINYMQNDIDSIGSTENIKVKKNNNTFGKMASVKEKLDDIVIKKKKTYPVETIKYKTLIIKSDEYTDSDYFNDYIINFEEPLNNIVRFQMDKIELPELKNNINESNNHFTYSINQEEKTIEIAEGYYNIDSIIEAIQSGFEHYEDDIIIELDDENLVNIKHKNNLLFDILNDNKCINTYLGFDQKIYCDKNYYRATNSHNIKIVETIYLYINDIKKNKPFAILNLTKDPIVDTPIIKNFKSFPKQLSDLRIKFKINNDNLQDILYDFDNRPHKLYFTIGMI